MDTKNLQTEPGGDQLPVGLPESGEIGLAEKKIQLEVKKLEAEAKKLEAEAKKFEVEARYLNKRWFNNPAFVGPIITSIMTLTGAVIIAYFSKFFDYTSTKYEKRIEQLSDSLNNQRKSANSLYQRDTKYNLNTEVMQANAIWLVSKEMKISATALYTKFAYDSAKTLNLPTKVEVRDTSNKLIKELIPRFRKNDGVFEGFE